MLSWSGVLQSPANFLDGEEFDCFPDIHMDMACMFPNELTAPPHTPAPSPSKNRAPKRRRDALDDEYNIRSSCFLSEDETLWSSKRLNCQRPPEHERLFPLQQDNFNQSEASLHSIFVDFAEGGATHACSATPHHLASATPREPLNMRSDKQHALEFNTPPSQALPDPPIDNFLSCCISTSREFAVGPNCANQASSPPFGPDLDRTFPESPGWGPYHGKSDHSQSGGGDGGSDGSDGTGLIGSTGSTVVAPKKAVSRRPAPARPNIDKSATHILRTFLVSVIPSVLKMEERDLHKLKNSTGLSERKIKRWFQNNRKRFVEPNVDTLIELANKRSKTSDPTTRERLNAMMYDVMYAKKIQGR